MWNYRVVRVEEEEYDSYQLYEIYYDDDGKIEYMTENAMQPYGESIEELRSDLEFMMEALRHPALDMKELEKSFEQNSRWEDIVGALEGFQNQKRDS